MPAGSAENFSLLTSWDKSASFEFTDAITAQYPTPHNASLGLQPQLTRRRTAISTPAQLSKKAAVIKECSGLLPTGLEKT
mmetsp:Transcript_42803/g.67086  ORF Transcript_42803/g.67086 Transcript_42803/m.67086 type:complete len:80 (-) Transcript_42803:28-267(-)